MKKILMFIMAIAMTMMLCGCDTAGSEVYASALNNLFDGVVIPALVSLAGVLAVLIMKKLETKFGIQIKAANQLYIKTMAEEAVQYVAEISAAALKKQAGISSEEKKITAIEKLQTAIPELTYKEADEAIHAALARIVGAGATGESALK